MIRYALLVLAIAAQHVGLSQKLLFQLMINGHDMVMDEEQAHVQGPIVISTLKFFCWTHDAVLQRADRHSGLYLPLDRRY